MINSYHYDHAQEAYKPSVIKCMVSLTSPLIKMYLHFLQPLYTLSLTHSTNNIKFLLCILFWAKGFTNEQNEQPCPHEAQSHETFLNKTH